MVDIVFRPFNVKPKYFFLESSYQGKNFKKKKKFFFYINSFDYSEFLRIKKKENENYIYRFLRKKIVLSQDC